MQYPKDFNEKLRKKPICGVLSIAMIAGVTFARATQACKNNMLSFQKRHGGKTYDEQRENALIDLGVRFRKILLDRTTLAAAIARHCRPGVTYMIMTSKHVVTVRDQIVADQVEIAHIGQHGARRCFVHHMLEIL